MKSIQLQTDRELEVLLVALATPLKGVEAIRLAGKCLDALERIANISYDSEGNLQIYKIENGQVKIENNQPVRACSLKQKPATLELEDAYFNFLKARVFEASEWSGYAAATIYRLLQKFEEAQ